MSYSNLFFKASEKIVSKIEHNIKIPETTNSFVENIIELSPNQTPFPNITPAMIIIKRLIDFKERKTNDSQSSYNSFQSFITQITNPPINNLPPPLFIKSTRENSK